MELWPCHGALDKECDLEGGTVQWRLEVRTRADYHIVGLGVTDFPFFITVPPLFRFWLDCDMYSLYIVFTSMYMYIVIKHIGFMVSKYSLFGIYVCVDIYKHICIQLVLHNDLLNE